MPPESAARAAEEIVCHCRQVPYATVRAKVDEGKARSLPEVQRETGACTRCFGCRYEIEGLLRERLGDEYVPNPLVERGPASEGPAPLRWARALRDRVAAQPPVKLYMPVLEGYRGLEVRTRIVLFNLQDEQQESEDVPVRADLTRLDGSREDVWRTTVRSRQSALLNLSDLAHEGALPEGVGTIKLVLDSSKMHSLRPYFHFQSPGGTTSTHEKHGRRRPERFIPMHYHWIFPITPKRRAEESYLFFVNTQARTMEEQQLVFRDTDGREESMPVPRLELDQGACLPLHEHFPRIADGSARGTVRLTPTVHVAGWMIQRDVEADLWRVQHL